LLLLSSKSKWWGDQHTWNSLIEIDHKHLSDQDRSQTFRWSK